MKWNTIENTEYREIKVTRLINASPAFVFNLYSTPEHVDQWWGPKGFTTRTISMDFQEGGIWDHVMTGPDGTEYVNRTVYKEIVKPSRIVYTNSGKDIVRDEFLTIISFEDVDGKTNLSVHMIFQTLDHYNNVMKFGAETGLHDTIDRLVGYCKQILRGKRE